MDSILVDGYSEFNKPQFSPELFSDNVIQPNSINGFPQNDTFRNYDTVDHQIPLNDTNHSSSTSTFSVRQFSDFSLSHHKFPNSITQNVSYGSHPFTDEAINLDDLNPMRFFVSETLDPRYSASIPYGAGPGVPDFSDACLKYMGDMLMDGDSIDEPVTVEDYIALQATEKSLYDALVEEHPLSIDQSLVVQNNDSPSDDFSQSFTCYEVNGFGVVENGSATDLVHGQRQHQSGFCPPTDGPSNSSSVSSSHSLASSKHSSDEDDRLVDSPSTRALASDVTDLGNFDWIKDAILKLGGNGFSPEMAGELGKMRNNVNGSKGRKRDDDDYQDRSSKHVASNVEEDVKLEQYDDIFLCKDVHDSIQTCHNCFAFSEASEKDSPTEKSKGRKGRGRPSKKQADENEGESGVDMSNLLTQCAQAVASFDLRTANELLKKIRLHSTPYGDSLQRVAHFFAAGLEARLSGSSPEKPPNCAGSHLSLGEFLNAYRSYVSAVPFKRTLFFLANKTIRTSSGNASRIHIIDLGAPYGVQWPCLIQNLSKRAIGPPKLRITSIDYPQPGYQPASKIETTGRQLAKYCDRFGVPFEFHPIAKRFGDLKADDIKIDKDEFLVVNCMFRASTLFDGTVDDKSPRDGFLNLIRKLKPDLFVHGIINGSLNAPFFITRFKETLFFFSAMFDMLETTMPREDKERLLVERELYGRCSHNIIACEGEARIERPETYKQWHVRHLRAGFKQLKFDQEIVNNAKAMLRANYNKNFLLDEDGSWVLQGWKGKLLYGISCWKPT